MNDTLYDRESLPVDLEIRFGVALGISPVCYPGDGALLTAHLTVLERAAGVLGYSGFDPERVRADLAASHDGAAVLALVPTPADHKAAAPGPDWMVVTEPFTPPDSAQPLRLVRSRHRRNHRSPTANALLVGDTELAMGTREAVDAGSHEVVWANLDDAVSCIGVGTCIAEIGGAIATPPRGDGPPDSGWRVACIERGLALETSIPLDGLRTATSVACLWPWGSVQAVARIDDIAYSDLSLARRISDGLAAISGSE